MSNSATAERRRPTGTARISWPMSAGLARHWWVVGLRAIAAALLLVGLVGSPPAKIASLVLVFAAYLAADGVLAILAGTLAARRGERWWLLVLEGSVNLGRRGRHPDMARHRRCSVPGFGECLGDRHWSADAGGRA